jgi:hypothetical protein
VNSEIEKYLKENPEQEPIAARRSVVCTLFNSLPDEERGTWEIQADKKKKLESVKSSEPLVGASREK